MKTVVLYTLALFWQIYKLIKVKKSLRWCKKIINQIQELDVLPVSELKKKIFEGVYKIGDNVLCKGKLVASEALKSSLDPARYVAYSQLVMDKVFEIGDSRNTVRKNIRKLYSGFLRLYQNGKQYINVYETMQSNVIPSKILSKVKSYREKIFNFSWLVSFFLRSPTRMISNVYKQSLIPNNSQNTIFGKIFRNKSGQLEFYRPIAITSSKEKMLVFYKEQLDSYTFLWYLLIFTIAITFFIIFKTYIEPTLIRGNLFLKKRSEFNGIQKIQVKDLNCYKCHKVLSNIINNPCGHLAICSDCNVGQNKCIECDRKAKDVVMVYPC